MTRRFTSLASLLDKALDERFSIRFKDGINLIKKFV
jgi:hypothetical protein